MVSTPVIVTIVSVCIGFVLFVLAASGARGKWDKRLVIGLLVTAVLCLTAVPLSVALSAAV
ncbi:hypothetical protein AB4Z09_27105 [Rhodococcus sp. TAF43]|uniref:hypothetical protein n=1 Tax=unclassified Rhodococcus (in: high G+C Gram-positive bacteria) TaxID=192944 RepID=UPI000E0B7030|nr:MULTISPECIES: hypothetical protein [unclassified Rhodococcus (in: high G+C Gram-positive bacteria)]QKT09567.1 hypothetical protein HUN07_01390 [Rhodococcus sp. W8901]RDI12338.1 hypothetical protein DEU38_1372 [Rhodococcus sp. AG1013]